MKLFDTDETDIPNFPTLYKKTNTGAIQYWKVKVVYHKPSCSLKREGSGEIIYEYGQLDTDKPQLTNDFIKSGKNIGKVNETSYLEQAILEAKAKWEKQKKKGYIESLQDAKEGKIDEDLIKGGINPMLAHKYRDHAEKIIYPAYGQPKFDGHRCIAIIDKKGKCSLWSRTRKKITSMIHIEKEIENVFCKKYADSLGHAGLILDGELYNHKYKARFEELSSAIRQEEQPENYDIIQYHIYDCVIDESFENRNNLLKNIIPKNNKFIKQVETILINNEVENIDYYKKCMSKGYEGSMIRNLHGLYEFKRSYHLQKVKQFDDAEFKIIGIEEGSGKLRGHVGAFVCITPQGNKFNVKMSGDVHRLKDYFENHKLWQGKKLTVQYQGITNKDKVPRFPVGIRIREDL